MIWRRKDPAEDHFVHFGHQETRIAALEADLSALTRDLLAYVTSDIASPWLKPANKLADTLQTIINRQEGLGTEK